MDARTLADRWIERRRLREPDGEAVELALPSGDAVKARRLSLTDLMKLERIPNRLLPVVLGWMDAFKAGDAFEDAAPKIAETIADDYRAFMDVLLAVWQACVVEPRFVPDEQWAREPGTLPFSWVSFDDLQYLFSWAQGVGGEHGETVVEFLRRRQAAGLALASHGEDVRRPAGGGDGDQPGREPVALPAMERGG